jgi:hypothetical protein
MTGREITFDRDGTTLRGHLVDAGPEAARDAFERAARFLETYLARPA